MRIGITARPERGGDALGTLVDQARAARDGGFSTFWTAQIFGADALTALAVVGREVPDIHLGTAVVPTFPRHPSVLAGQALTTNLATGGRLRLGIGLSHKVVVEGMWGYSFDRPLRHLREYLDALLPLLHGEDADVAGSEVTARGAVNVAGATPPPVYVAALGPKMLALAGARTDGTITWMTGARTLATHTVPTIRAAAAAAGRPEPGVVASFPFCVTDNVDFARQRAANIFAMYGQLPSYRAMLDREGLEGPGDIAIIGDEAACRARVDEIMAAGVTELSASEFGTADELARTRAFLRSLLDG
jgi:5,10-methylenetetrahydromethanopterin reductase